MSFDIALFYYIANRNEKRFMKKITPILPLFKQFIKETETGKRLKKKWRKNKIRINSKLLLCFE